MPTFPVRPRRRAFLCMCVMPDACAVALAGILPARHPNVTTLILNPRAVAMPADHPPIDPWLGNLSMPSYTPYRCGWARIGAGLRAA